MSLLSKVRLKPINPPGVRVCRVIDDLGSFLCAEAAANDATGRFAAASIRRLNEAGVLAACAPVEDGGFGLTSLHDLAAVTARLAHYDASVAIGMCMHLALSWYYARAVRCGEGSQNVQQREWCRGIGARSMIVSSAVAEPGVDPFHLRTTAVRIGGGWSITGRKILASISPAATHFYTRLKVETRHGPRQGTVMIPADAPGVDVKNDWDGLGLRGSGSGQVVFTDVVVRLEELGLRGAWGARSRGDEEGRAANSPPIVGVYLGIAEAARDQALRSLTRSRKGDVRKRNNTSATHMMVAEMEVNMVAASGALKAVLLELDAHITNTAPRAVPRDIGRDLLVQSVCAGMIVERAAMDVVDAAMQLTGGSSYLKGSLLGRLYRDVRAAAFMRPYAPLEEWADFVADATLDFAGVSTRKEPDTRKAG